MHILLTDISACPRCGPQYGLILLIDELVDRRVRRGALACPNCKQQYPIVAGTGDFRLGEVRDFGPPIAAAVAMRLMALAGVTSSPARLLVIGPAAAHAAALAAALADVEVVAATAEGGEAAGGRVSRIAVAGGLPFYDNRFAGVILSGAAAELLLSEGARVLGPGGRLVLEPSPAGAAERLRELGLVTLAAEGATLVAARS